MKNKLYNIEHFLCVYFMFNTVPYYKELQCILFGMLTIDPWFISCHGFYQELDGLCIRKFALYDKKSARVRSCLNC